MLTACWISALVNSPWLQKLVKGAFWLDYACLGAMLIIMMTLVLNSKSARHCPTNFALLGLFTLGQAWCLGNYWIDQHASEVFGAFTMTFLLTLLTLHGYQTKSDFSWGSNLVWCFAITSTIVLLTSQICAHKVIFQGLSALILLIFARFLV